MFSNDTRDEDNDSTNEDLNPEWHCSLSVGTSASSFHKCVCVCFLLSISTEEKLKCSMRPGMSPPDSLQILQSADHRLNRHCV